MYLVGKVEPFIAHMTNKENNLYTLTQHVQQTQVNIINMWGLICTHLHRHHYFFFPKNLPFEPISISFFSPLSLSFPPRSFREMGE